MSASSDLAAPRLVPLMRYRDLAAAVDWLCNAFAFEKQVAVSDADGSTVYAQLTYGNSMVMLGAVRETDLDALLCQPDEVGGAETQSCYVVVDDIDEHYARALDSGAEILLGIKSDGFGRRGYSCRDPQGHIWNFGTYNPWKGRLPVVQSAEPRSGSPLRRTGLTAAAALAFLLAGFGVGWLLGGGAVPPTNLAVESSHLAGPSSADRVGEAERRTGEAQPYETSAGPTGALSAAPDETGAIGAEIEAARAKAEAAERAVADALADAGRERTEKEAAQRAQARLEQELAEKTSALDEAVQGREEARLELAKARNALDTFDEEKAALEAAKAALEAEKAGLEDALKRTREHAAAETGTQRADPPAASTATGPTTIETSAVDAAAGTRAAPRSQAKRIAVYSRGRRTVARLKRPITAVPPGKTTYITELRDVPWPYSVWEPRWP